MRKSIYLLVIVALVTAGLANAEEKELKVTLDVKYMSKYMSKGVEAYGSQGVVFETMNIDLWGTGFGVGFGHQSATGTSGPGYVNSQRFNSSVFYANKALEGERLETKYKVSWTSKNYYGVRRNAKDSQEYIASFMWPNLLGVDGLAPYYITHYETPRGSGYDNAAMAGWVHRFGLSKVLNVEALPNPLIFTSEICYNDGYGSATRDHDWAFMTYGLSSKFKLADNLTFVPGLYYQKTMDQSHTGSNDILYTSLGVKLAF
jgi:hypothetical protein